MKNMKITFNVMKKNLCVVLVFEYILLFGRNNCC